MFFVLAVCILEIGAVTKHRKNKNLIKNEAHKPLDLSINVSHNRNLSDKGIIQIVKLLARQAAEEDYLQSIIQDQGGESS